jgi:hypothetical protein
MSHLSPTHHETSKYVSPYETDSWVEPSKFSRFKFEARQVNYSSQAAKLTNGKKNGKPKKKQRNTCRCFFFAPARYRVVKIVCSCSEVVLQTMKNYKSHYSLSWFKPLLQGNSPMSNIFCIEEEE